MLFVFDTLLSQIKDSQLGMIMKTDAQRENQVMVMEMFNRWSNLMITRYDWQNLPSGVDERLLNIGLYCQGSCAFFNDPVLGVTALPCNHGNTFNFLYQPTSVTIFGYGMSRQINDPSKFGFVRSTPTGMPLALTVYEYVRRMADVLRAIDVVNQRLKRPYIIKCDEKERLTIMNLFKRVKDNEELILGQKNYPLDNRSFDIAPLPYAGNTELLWQTYHAYERLLYTAIGVQTVPEEKRERLLVDEVNSNNMVIELANETNLKELTLCIEKVNKIFGTNISVSLKELKNFDDDKGFTYEEGDDDG